MPFKYDPKTVQIHVPGYLLVFYGANSDRNCFLLTRFSAESKMQNSPGNNIIGIYDNYYFFIGEAAKIF